MMDQFIKKVAPQTRPLAHFVLRYRQLGYDQIGFI